MNIELEDFDDIFWQCSFFIVNKLFGRYITKFKKKSKFYIKFLKEKITHIPEYCDLRKPKIELRI